jgi:hypothetical protein
VAWFVQIEREGRPSGESITVRRSGSAHRNIDRRQLRRQSADRARPGQRTISAAGGGLRRLLTGLPDMPKGILDERALDWRTPMYLNHSLNHWFSQVWRQWTGWSVVLAFLVLLCGCSAATSSPASPPPSAAGTSEASVAASSPSVATAGPPRSVPARIAAKRRLAEREEDLTIESPAVGGQLEVRLLLPVHYETEKARSWPVLYLLHGCCDSYVSWTRSTDAEQLTQRSDILVVMPGGGKAGFYPHSAIQRRVAGLPRLDPVAGRRSAGTMGRSGCRPGTYGSSTTRMTSHHN